MKVNEDNVEAPIVEVEVEVEVEVGKAIPFVSGLPDIAGKKTGFFYFYLRCFYGLNKSFHITRQKLYFTAGFKF